MTGKLLTAIGAGFVVYEVCANAFGLPLLSRWTGRPRLVRDAWLAGLAAHFYLESRKS